MRIIAGIARSRRLKSVRGQRVRPTADRVKESIFSILGEIVVDARVLDLFAGTGNLGFEALSRGAGYAVFVDDDKQSIQVIRENIASLGFEKLTQVIQGILPKTLSRVGSKQSAVGSSGFDLVFIDPPYLQDYEVATITGLVEYKLLNTDATVVIEHHRKTLLPKAISGLTLVREQRYGDTAVSFYKKIQTDYN